MVEGWVAIISSSHIPFAYLYIDISSCYLIEPHIVHYDTFVHLALQTFSHLGWEPLIVHFAITCFIGEYCEHIMSSFVCSLL